MITDFIQYWVAARIYWSGGNPYSPAAVFAIEQQAGWPEPLPLLMWNPPWILPLILPLGWLDYDTARFVWFFSHALTVMLSARSLWKMFGGVSQKFHYAWLSVLTFVPVYFALMFGQIGPLVLLGVVGFLFFSRRGQWGWAGACLALAAVKPHLLYLLWPTLLLWLLSDGRLRFAAYLIGGSAITAALPLYFNPEIYFHYLDLLRNNEVVGLNDWPTPTLGMALSQLFSVTNLWFRWLPSVAGLVWLLWYWQRHAAAWHWFSELPLVLVVSTATTGFAWPFDYVILLPAVIQCAIWTSEMEKRPRRTIIAVHAALALIMIAGKAVLGNHVLSMWFFWMAPAFLFLYLSTRAVAQGTPKAGVRGTFGPADS
jgi:hypothetical protein